MSIELVSHTQQAYHLIAYDANGRELPESGGVLASEMVTDDPPHRDVHRRLPAQPRLEGRHPGRPGASTTPGSARWPPAPPTSTPASRGRPASARLLIGLHWPSLPWGDETLPEAGRRSPPAGRGDPVEELVDDAAAKIVDTRQPARPCGRS